MLNQHLEQTITQWIEQNREKVLHDWMELVRIPSIQGTPEPGAPYGRECARVLQAAADMFGQWGFENRVDTESGYGLAFSGNGEKTIGLFGHSDVVPVGEGWLFTEPFVPVIKDGLLIGRGASDNKAGIMASLCAMAILRDGDIPFGSRIQAFIGSNEETGMLDVQGFAAKERMPEVSLVPDGGFPCVMGEKGILRMWAEHEAVLEDVIACTGGDAFNVVLDKVNITLRPNAALEAQLREQGAELTVTEDGHIQMCIRGVAKHAASPEGGVNALVKAAKLLCSCEALAEADRSAMASAAFLLEPYYGENLGIAHEDSCFGKLSAANGMVKVENGRLHASLDVRYGVELAPETLEQKLQAGWGKEGWKIKELINEPGFKAAVDCPVPEIMEQLFHEVTGLEGKPYLMSGGTYARHLKNAFPVGVSTECVGKQAPALQMPAGHGGAHQCDEYIDIEDFFRAVRIITHALVRLDAWLCDK